MGGYPSGLERRRDFALGARILRWSIMFDALMSERPYHRAMSLDAAMGLLRQEISKAPSARRPDLHRHVRDAGPRKPRRPGDGAQLTRVPTHAPTAAPAVGPWTRTSRRCAQRLSGHRARASRDHAPLRRIALRTKGAGQQSRLSDTMALISSKLSNIVPFRARAVSLQRRVRNAALPVLRPAWHPRSSSKLTIRNGHCLTGWVAPQPPAAGEARRAPISEAAGVASVARRSIPALVCRLLFNERFIGRFRSTTPRWRSTPTTTAGCSTASPSRPPRSIYNSMCSSIPRKIR